MKTKKMNKEKGNTIKLEPVVFPPARDIVSVEKTPTWLMRQLEKRVKIGNGVEKVIFIGITNRTNTGALATAIGRAPTDPPTTRHIQPVKAIARQIMVEEKGMDPSTPLKFLRNTIDLNSKINIIKETIGPNPQNPAEWVDALTLFLNKGLPPEKLLFVPTLREPIDVVSSWKRMWKWDWIDFPFQSFNHSFETTVSLIRRCNDLGIPVVPYIHEFLRDFGPEKVVGKMFTQLGLPFSRQVVAWDNPNTKKDDKTDWYFEGNIVKYDLPPNDWIQGALGVAKGGRGELRWEASKLALTQEELDFIVPRIERSEEIYRQVKAETRKQLDLEVE